MSIIPAVFWKITYEYADEIEPREQHYLWISNSYEPKAFTLIDISPIAQGWIDAHKWGGGPIVVGIDLVDTDEDGCISIQ